MPISELIISQAPLWQEYAEATRVQWSFSRHPENIADVMTAAKDSTEELSAKDKFIFYGAMAITAAQQLPVNEIAVGLGVGVVLEATNGNIPAAVATTAIITGAAELASSTGIAYSLDKQRSAIDIISDRYVDKEKIERKAQERAEKGKKPASELGRIYLVASILLSSGATIYEDLRDRARTMKDNMRTAKIASAMVTANYCAVTAVVAGVAGGLDSAGVQGSTEALTDGARNPLFMSLIVGGLFGAIKLRERVRTARRIKAKRTELENHTEFIGNNEQKLSYVRTAEEF